MTIKVKDVETRPVRCFAVRWDGTIDGFEEILNWMRLMDPKFDIQDRHFHYTPKGTWFVVNRIHVEENGWVVRNTKQQRFDPYDDETFEDTFRKRDI